MFYTAIRYPVKTLVRALLSDVNLREKVLYRRYTGQAYDPAAGYTKSTYDDSYMYAARMIHNQISVAASSSDVEVGDVAFLFHGDDFPQESSLKDLIVDSDGNELGLKGIDPIFELAVSVTVLGTK